jgi:hypothetical protein
MKGERAVEKCRLFNEILKYQNPDETGGGRERPSRHGSKSPGNCGRLGLGGASISSTDVKMNIKEVLKNDR